MPGTKPATDWWNEWIAIWKHRCRQSPRRGEQGRLAVEEVLNGDLEEPTLARRRGAREREHVKRQGQQTQRPQTKQNSGNCMQFTLLEKKEQGRGGLRDAAGEVGRAETTTSAQQARAGAWFGPTCRGGICSPSRPFPPLCREHKQGRQSVAKMESSGGSCGRSARDHQGPQQGREWTWRGGGNLETKVELARSDDCLACDKVAL